MRSPARIAALVLVALGSPLTASASSPVAAAPVPGGASTLPAESALAVSIGYSRYEPAFYTGFAPRIPEPERLHVRIGRGNQLRVTAVLSDEVLEGYGRELEARRARYVNLVQSAQIELTQNDGLSPFLTTLERSALDARLAAQQDLAPAEIRRRNLALMEQLNPGRVFRISMPLDEVIARWQTVAIESAPPAGPRGRQGRVDLANAMLPTRLTVRALSTPQAASLNALMARADESPASLRDDFAALLDSLAPGRYPRVEDRLEFVEFTAIHPIGSFNDYVVHKGRKIPMYPTPGRRALMTHQRTRTPDHIPTNLAYSYAPWLPYMHVGSRLHNSFHTLWWKMTPSDAKFLPAQVGAREHRDRDGRPHRYLWVLSRGPMSSGCTHVNLGHILELRQMLPAEASTMFDVEVFINQSHQFDVFDIDGDLEPEVMGVEYFVAYSLRNKRPHRLRAPTERGAYYDWLYGGELEVAADGKGHFEDVRDSRFVGRRARDGKLYERVRLYEASLEPQRLQFFAPKPIDFVRELRKAGARQSERVASADRAVRR